MSFWVQDSIFTRHNSFVVAGPNLIDGSENEDAVDDRGESQVIDTNVEQLEAPSLVQAMCSEAAVIETFEGRRSNSNEQGI